MARVGELGLNHDRRPLTAAFAEPDQRTTRHAGVLAENLLARLGVQGAAGGFDPLGFDELCQRSGLTPESASAMLLTLELEGVVSRLPGGMFQRVR